MAGFFTLSARDYILNRAEDRDFDASIAAANAKAAQQDELERRGRKPLGVNPAYLPRQGDDRPPPVTDVGPALGSVIQRVRPRERPVAGLTTVETPAAKAPTAAAPRTVVGELDPNLSPLETQQRQSKLRSEVGAGIGAIRRRLTLGQGTAPATNMFRGALDFINTPQNSPNREQRQRAITAEAWYSSPAAVDFFRANPAALAEAQERPIEFFEMVTTGKTSPVTFTDHDRGLTTENPGTPFQTKFGSANAPAAGVSPPPGAQPAATSSGPAIPPASKGSTIPNRAGAHRFLLGLESSNGTDPAAGAYVYQTTKSTAENPGFGIAPAKDDSAAEYNRVGAQYFDVFLRRNPGNLEHALLEYRFGPGAFGKWKSTGFDPAKAPRDNKLGEDGNQYLAKVRARLAGQPVPASASAPLPEKVKIRNSGAKRTVEYDGGLHLGTDPAAHILVKDPAKRVKPSFSLSFAARSRQMQGLMRARESVAKQARIAAGGSNFKLANELQIKLEAFNTDIEFMALDQGLNLLANGNNPTMLSRILSEQLGRSIQISMNSDGTISVTDSGRLVNERINKAQFISKVRKQSDQQYAGDMNTLAAKQRAKVDELKIKAALNIMVEDTKGGWALARDELKLNGFKGSEQDIFKIGGRLMYLGKAPPINDPKGKPVIRLIELQGSQFDPSAFRRASR